MNLLKNKRISLHVNMDPKPTTSVDNAPAAERLTADDLAQIAMYHANHAAVLVAALYLGHKVVKTSSEIAVIAAIAHFNK